MSTKPNSLESQIKSYINSHDKAYIAGEIRFDEVRVCLLCCVNGIFLAVNIIEGRNKHLGIQEDQVDDVLEAGGKIWFIRKFAQFTDLFEGIYNG